MKAQAGLKGTILGVSRALGLFVLSRRLHRRKLLILCYHGIQASDEASWWPGVFVSRETFAARMELLKRHSFNVLSLTEAFSRLKSGTLPPNSVVITVDDGYKNTPREMLPVLAAHRYPATVYVTTYYVQKQHPIFRLAVQYMFWRSAATDLGAPLPKWASSLRSGELSSEASRREAAWACIDYGEQQCTEDERQQLLRELGRRLDVDYDGIRSVGGLSLMNEDEIGELVRAGIDVQLHTHRHRFPEEREAAMRELDDNVAVLQPLTDTRLDHFCYPSGIYSERHHPWLREAGIATATTCRIGFNDAGTSAYELKRYLDREDVSEIEFLAEISGYSSLLRRLRGRIRRRGGD